MFLFFALMAAPIASIGWMTPISLLASITLTTVVSGPTAPATCSGVSRPSGAGLR